MRRVVEAEEEIDVRTRMVGARRVNRLVCERVDLERALAKA